MVVLRVVVAFVVVVLAVVVVVVVPCVDGVAWCVPPATQPSRTLTLNST